MLTTSRLGIEYLLNKLKGGSALTDKAYDNMPFLKAREAVYNEKGEKVSKSFYSHYKNKEIVRQEYHKIIATHIHDEVEYPDTFIGTDRRVYHLHWDGTLHFKGSHIYEFTLTPVYKGDNTSIITGFSSRKKRRFLKDERYAADDYLQSKNPSLYAFVYSFFREQYEVYLRTGESTALVDSLNNTTEQSILDVLNNVVDGTVDTTVKQLIIMNLQGV